jgi:DHA1 family inner membrane transport protein
MMSQRESRTALDDGCPPNPGEIASHSQPARHIPSRRVGALLALSVAAFAFVTAETLPIALLDPISHDLNASASAVGLLVTAYGLVVVVTSIPLARATRRLPRRAVLTVVLAVFVVTTLISAAATGYPMLLIARIVMALSQALFWALVVPTAAGLYPSHARGRAIAVVFAGSSLAGVLGVPAATWVGQQLGWRVAVLALAAVGLLALLALATFLSGNTAELDQNAGGTSPNARRYGMLIAVTVLGVMGVYTTFTFINPFLTGVAGFQASALGPLLLMRGVAGLLGVVAGGALADKHPRAAILLPTAAQAAALIGLDLFGGSPIVTLALVALSGFSFTAMTTALGSRVLQVAPRSVEMAAAGLSTAVNVGITVGALAGSALVVAWDVRSTALIGGILGAAAVLLAIVEPRIGSSRSGRAPAQSVASTESF